MLEEEKTGTSNGLNTKDINDNYSNSGSSGDCETRSLKKTFKSYNEKNADNIDFTVDNLFRPLHVDSLRTSKNFDELAVSLKQKDKRKREKLSKERDSFI